MRMLWLSEPTIDNSNFSTSEIFKIHEFSNLKMTQNFKNLLRCELMSYNTKLENFPDLQTYKARRMR